MGETDYRFCKIFAETDEEPAVMGMLVDLLGGQFQRRDLYLQGLVVSVLPNPDAAETDPGADFVRWPLLVELDAEGAEGEGTIVNVTSRIVTALWGAGTRAVAACDFEAELPWRGGIGRLRDG